ncbi:hypothetical protein BDV25DRAFT_139497 [Aspergillus avenaceus]|uniref:Uncharacterized protein n=1 Tax=Aspergillus avenaceus TaxID=36643 RepID=A0A5N6TWQ3_ASPAV|nr:hypothetical protein BDV25DRAFT_139497 [Aspergillus avenaceus]
MRFIIVFATLLAVAYGASLETRQQGQGCIEVHSPDTCGAHGRVKCDGSAGFLKKCY